MYVMITFIHKKRNITNHDIKYTTNYQFKNATIEPKDISHTLTQRTWSRDKYNKISIMFQVICKNLR